jgi:hypothetical protein
LTVFPPRSVSGADAYSDWFFFTPHPK